MNHIKRKPKLLHYYASLFKSLISQQFQFPIQIFVRGYSCHSLISLINNEWKQHFKQLTMVFNLCKSGRIQKQSMPQSTPWCSDKSVNRWKDGGAYVNLPVAHHLCKMDKKRDKLGRLLIQFCLWMFVGKSAGDSRSPLDFTQKASVRLRSNGIRFVALIRSKWELLVKSAITTAIHGGRHHTDHLKHKVAGRNCMEV